ncbi:MAG: EF-hand domain-containing protein [Candidatus Thiodiazotropha sp.]
MKALKTSLAIGLFFALIGLTNAETPTTSARGPLPFEVFDQDGNGSISPQEFESVHAQRRQTPNTQGGSARRLMDPPDFSTFDVDANGSLSPAELAEGQRNRQSQRMTGPAAGQMMKGGGMGFNMPTFSEFDLDGNGVLQEDEFQQARANRIRERSMKGYQMRNLKNAPPFASIDSNGDGTISREEFSAAQQQHRQMRTQ